MRYNDSRALPTGSLVTAAVAAMLLTGCSGGDTSTSSQPAAAPSAAAPTESKPADSTPREPETTSLTEIFPEGEGQTLVLDNCGSCHAVACSAIGQRTRARWDNLKEGHKQHVASLSAEELETIFAYLKENFNDTKPEPAVPAHFLEAGCTPF